MSDQPPATTLTRWQQVGVAVAFALGVMVLGFLSGQVGDSDSLWYWGLQKPFFQPPPWLFGPVWTILYVMIGVAAFLVWRRGFGRSDVRWALALFGIQLAFNLAWTPIFFGAQSVGGALLVILALLPLLVLTIRQFLQVDRLAGWLLIPYLAWVAFATILNFSIWLLN
jgi:translocator protein